MFSRGGGYEPLPSTAIGVSPFFVLQRASCVGPSVMGYSSDTTPLAMFWQTAESLDVVNFLTVERDASTYRLVCPHR